MSTSISAVMSDPVNDRGEPSLFDGAANPITTRAGKPSWSAMSAAAAEYCSASPIMSGSVKSWLRRSSPWPERLTGSFFVTP